MRMWKVLTLAIAVVAVAAPALAGFTTWLPPSIQTEVSALALLWPSHSSSLRS